MRVANRIAAAVVAIVVVAPSGVSADWRDELWWADKAISSDGHMGRPHYDSYSQRRVYYEQHYRRWRAYRQPQVASYIYREPEYRAEHRHEHEWNNKLPGDRGVTCHAREDVVGDLANSEAGALSKAERHFQATARYKHGERYLDLTNARGYRKRCDRASTNETIVGKLTEAVVGDAGVQYRCFVSAQPCKANLDQGRSGR
jgi:hypothetical protein